MLSIIVTAFYYLIWIINILILARCVLSWFPGGNDSHTGYLLIMMTEPILGPIRSLLKRIRPLQNQPLDFSPLVAILLLSLIMGLISML